MRTSRIVTSAIGGLLFTLVACGQPTSGATVGSAGNPVDDGGGTTSGEVGPGSSSGAGGTDGGSDMDANGMGTPDATVVAGGGSDSCADATAIPLSAANPRVDLLTSTLGATHDIDVSCSPGAGPDVFYKFVFAKRVLIYADTFGASWNTSLFLLDDSCNPITTSTTPGDSVCSTGACGTSQGRIVALLEPGFYRLGLSGQGGASGTATIHFEWTLAGSGNIAPLPKGMSTQTGTTGGGGNIDGLDSKCLAAGGEDSYWWARCPNDAAGSVTASTCGGADWDSIVDVQIPGGTKTYTCAEGTCGNQSSLTTAVPAGAGLGVVSIDGQGGTDYGNYSMIVTRP